MRAIVCTAYGPPEVPDAHRYVDLGHQKGNMIVAVDELGAG